MVYNRSVDGIRGLAILLVLLFHFQTILGCGWLGVQLFFVLSGYLISTILLKEKERHPLGFYLKRFYWRRTVRIFPLYYAYLLLVTLVFILKAIPEEFPEYIPYLASYTFNLYPLLETYSYDDSFFIHFWSLSVEEQFYLIWPLVIFITPRKNLKYVLLGIIVMAPVVRYLLQSWLLEKQYESFYAGETVYRFTLGQWDGFAFGALIPLFSLDKIKFPVSKLFLGSAVLFFGAGMINYLTLNEPLALSTLGYPIAGIENLQVVWSYTISNCFFMMLIVFIININIRQNWLRDTFFASPVMVYMGKISYGLYVYHWIIWMTYNKYFLSTFHPAVGFLLFMIVTAGISTVSFYAFEKPILGLKDKYFSKRQVVYENA